jgi:cobalamin biosynthesis protein CobD/CbiB
MNYLWKQAKIHNLVYGLLLILKFLLWITHAKRKLWYKFQIQILTKTSLIKIQAFHQHITKVLEFLSN